MPESGIFRGSWPRKFFTFITFLEANFMYLVLASFRKNLFSDFGISCWPIWHFFPGESGSIEFFSSGLMISSIQWWVWMEYLSPICRSSQACSEVPARSLRRLYLYNKRSIDANRSSYESYFNSIYFRRRHRRRCTNHESSSENAAGEMELLCGFETRQAEKREGRKSS